MPGIGVLDRVFLALESENTPQHVAAVATFTLPAGAGPDSYLQRLFGQLSIAPVVAPFVYRLRHPRLGALAGPLEVPQKEVVRPLWSIATIADQAADAHGPGKTTARLVAERAAGLAGTAVGLARAAGIMLRGVRALDDPGRAVPFAIPRSPVNGAAGRRRLVVLRSYALDRFRVVAKAADGTVNEVLLSVCGGALGQCLTAAGMLPARSLIAGTPVSTRSAADTTTGNALAMTVMSLSTDVAQNVLGLAGATRPPYNIALEELGDLLGDELLALERAVGGPADMAEHVTAPV
jgi:hypothetical protein